MLYRLSRWLLREAREFCFACIEQFHRQRVLSKGPIAFTSRPPNSVGQSFKERDHGLRHRLQSAEIRRLP